MQKFFFCFCFFMRTRRLRPYCDDSSANNLRCAHVRRYFVALTQSASTKRNGIIAVIAGIMVLCFVQFMWICVTETSRHPQTRTLLISVLLFFKYARAVLFLGYGHGFVLPKASSCSLLHVSERQRLWRDCAYAQSRLSLCWSPIQ